MFDRFPYGREYYEDNYNILQNELLKADLIIPTHEHWDHLGAVAQSDNLKTLLPETVLTREQVNGPTIKDAEFPDDVFSNYSPLEYDTYYQAALGMVLIKAPGHSTGHQFVFVRLQSGKEFLFTGDVVWTNKNYEKKKSRPWIASKSAWKTVARYPIR